MKIGILGGDGFVGWPTALRLSNKGHEVHIIDNLSRRSIDQDLDVRSLTPIASIYERIDAWKEVTGHKIKFHQIDIQKEYDLLSSWLKNERPDVIVHFAEQRAAPYSMKSAKHKCYTVNNNVSGTHNLMAAIVEQELDTHIVHLGTMGVYGYSSVGAPIPEGYLNVNIDLDGKQVSKEILYPANPGSVYHMTKCMDQLVFQYYAKNDNIKITDLHQGIVWGTNTEETNLDERLINRFDYDGDYGTVLNRFLIQAATGHELTVHGTGGQTRAFIHIQDSIKCIEIAIQNPPKESSKVKIFNQATETHRVIDLAKMINGMTGAEIAYVQNPRNEAVENDLIVKNDQFLNLGLNPVKLKEGLLEEILNVAAKYGNRIDTEKIPCVSLWNNDIKKALTNSALLEAI